MEVITVRPIVILHCQSSLHSHCSNNVEETHLGFACSGSCTNPRLQKIDARIVSMHYRSTIEQDIR